MSICEQTSIYFQLSNGRLSMRHVYSVFVMNPRLSDHGTSLRTEDPQADAVKEQETGGSYRKKARKHRAGKVARTCGYPREWDMFLLKPLFNSTSCKKTWNLMRKNLKLSLEEGRGFCQNGGKARQLVYWQLICSLSGVIFTRRQAKATDKEYTFFIWLSCYLI